MGKLISLLAGSAGGWILAGGVLVSVLAGGTAGYMARGMVDAKPIAEARQHQAEAASREQQCIATHEKGRADGAEKVIGALSAAGDAAVAAMTDLAAKARDRDVKTNAFLTELSHVPLTKVCAASPAELALRRGVQPSASPAAP